MYLQAVNMHGIQCASENETVMLHLIVFGDWF